MAKAAAGSIFMLAVAVVVAAVVPVTAAVPLPAINVTTIAFREGYVPLFGEHILRRSEDDRNVQLVLDPSSGSGFISSGMYDHGFFSASIKLPADYTAGIVVAFYTSNGDVFEKTHDELDFEFLGNLRGKPWRVQTNLYGNGSTNRGREERYFLPFDPTRAFHRYSILWTADNIIFYIDDTPIREVRRSEVMGADYPSKPMSLYATIWDASNWATNGGKYKVMYRYGPFASEFKDLALLGCRLDPIQRVLTRDCADADAELAATRLAVMTPERREAMRAFRERYMSYSYCYDTLRYPEGLPECEVVESEKARLSASGHLLRLGGRRRQIGRRGRAAGAAEVKAQADM